MENISNPKLPLLNPGAGLSPLPWGNYETSERYVIPLGLFVEGVKVPKRTMQIDDSSLKINNNNNNNNNGEL